MAGAVQCGDGEHMNITETTPAPYISRPEGRGKEWSGLQRTSNIGSGGNMHPQAPRVGKKLLLL